MEWLTVSNAFCKSTNTLRFIFRSFKLLYKNSVNNVIAFSVDLPLRNPNCTGVITLNLQTKSYNLTSFSATIVTENDERLKESFEVKN